MNGDPSCSPSRGDLTCGRAGLLLWVLPVIVLGVSAGFGGLYAAIAWPPLLVLMGVACLVNARRCGRLHCYVTGPYFLLLAAVALLYSLDVLPLGPGGWQWLTSALLVGGCALTCIPEWLFGRYVPRPGTDQRGS